MRLIRKIIPPLITFWLGGVSVLIAIFHSQTGILPSVENLYRNGTLLWPWEILKYLVGA